MKLITSLYLSYGMDMFEGYVFGSVKSGKMVQDCVFARSLEKERV